MSGGPLPRLTLVLGGAASGKSAHAESLVSASGLRPVYVATATAGDDEMAERIARHRARRGPAWATVEAPLDLAPRLREAARPGSAVLVDCLTLWLGNLVGGGRDVPRGIDALASALAAAEAPVVAVSNELGSGIVPGDAPTRRFRDLHGGLNQTVAGAADSVVLVVAGVPIAVKGPAA